MVDRPTEIGRCYGKEISVGKTEVMRITRQPFPIQITRDQKQPENVEYFTYMDSIQAVDQKHLGSFEM